MLYVFAKDVNVNFFVCLLFIHSSVANLMLDPLRIVAPAGWECVLY